MKPFTDVIGEIENGAFLKELTEATYNMVASVTDTRKPGVLTIKLGFAPTGRGSVEISTKVESKEPEHDRATTTFFVGQGFVLMRDDPRQQKLPLREVELPNNTPAEVKA